MYYITAGHIHQQQNCEPKIMDTSKATNMMQAITLTTTLDKYRK